MERMKQRLLKCNYSEKLINNGIIFRKSKNVHEQNVLYFQFLIIMLCEIENRSTKKSPPKKEGSIKSFTDRRVSLQYYIPPPVSKSHRRLFLGCQITRKISP